MKTEVTRVDIFNTSNVESKEILDALLKVAGESIHEIINLYNNIIVVRDIIFSLHYDAKLDLYHGQDINIAIASAVTAGARVHMSQFKNNPNYNLYYSDTDSIVIDSLLSPEQVGSNLGQVKLEHVVNRAIFLAPKVYGLITENGEEIIKIKGVNPEAVKSINIGDLEQLLVKDSIKEISQIKWYKKVLEGEITLNEIAYTLKVNSNIDEFYEWWGIKYKYYLLKDIISLHSFLFSMCLFPIDRS